MHFKIAKGNITADQIIAVVFCFLCFFKSFDLHIHRAHAPVSVHWDSMQEKLDLSPTPSTDDVITLSLSISGTPAWSVGGKLLTGAVGREALQQAVDAARKG